MADNAIIKKALSELDEDWVIEPELRAAILDQLTKVMGKTEEYMRDNVRRYLFLRELLTDLSIAKTLSDRKSLRGFLNEYEEVVKRLGI